MTDLATRATPPAPRKMALEGFEEVDQSLVILPRWSITQPTSQFENIKGHEGWFHRNIDGAYRERLTGVILQCRQERVLWGDLGDRRPLCVSRDGGLTGSLPRNDAGEFGACATCAYNVAFNRELSAERDRGLPVKICGFGLRFVLVDDLDEGTMALYSAMGTSVRPARTLITQFAQRRRPAYGAVVEFRTAENKNDRGRFYVLDATVQRWLDGAELERFRALYLSLKGVVVEDVADDDEAGPGDDESVPF
jgi:hypothetical protein